MQDSTLNRIKELDENHDRILKKLEEFDIRHETTLDTIAELSKKVDTLVKKQEKLDDSTKSDSAKIANDFK